MNEPNDGPNIHLAKHHLRGATEAMERLDQLHRDAERPEDLIGIAQADALIAIAYALIGDERPVQSSKRNALRGLARSAGLDPQ